MTVHPHNLSGAYALDALTDEERAAFEIHLAECSDCAAEVDTFLATSARLGAAAEEALPPDLKAKIMAAVADTPQERPVVTALHRGTRVRRIATRALLAAAALALIVSTGAFLVERDQNAQLQAEQRQISQVLGADDVAVASRNLARGGSVRLVTSAGLDRAVLLTEDLPKLDSKHDYQLWTLKGEKARSVDVLAGDEQAGTQSRLITGVTDADAVALTVEPAGGSKAPTTTPLAALKTA